MDKRKLTFLFSLLSPYDSCVVCNPISKAIRVQRRNQLRAAMGCMGYMLFIRLSPELRHGSHLCEMF